MPAYHKFGWEDFRVIAEPIGIRRFLRCLPYFTGSEPNFKVTINTISGKLRQLESTLDCFEPDQTAMAISRNLSWHETPINNISKEVKVPPIGVSGDHRFQITLCEKGKQRYRRDLITFTAISGDWVIVSVILAAFTVIGGIIGGLIVRFI